MIDINTLEPNDEGRWVFYNKFDGTQELGRLKSWKGSTMFVVFKCNSQWVDYLNYTGESCSPLDLSWKHEDGSDKQTVTIFRKWSDTKDIIALFPEIPGDKNFDTCSSYMHVGQHGASHIDTVFDNTDAVRTYYGYRDLMVELIDIGYNVKVTDTLLSEYNKSRRQKLKNG